MSILSIVLLVLFVIVCILLILMVVIQDEDGSSIGGIFADSSQSAFGSRASNVLVKFTYILGALFFVSALGLALLNKKPMGNAEEAGRRLNEGQVNEWWSAQPAQETIPGLDAPAAVSPPTELPVTPTEPGSGGTVPVTP